MSIPKMAKAMGYIDDDLVSGAIEYKRTKKKNTWVKWGAMAACLCLMVIGALTIENSLHHKSEDPLSGKFVGNVIEIVDSNQCIVEITAGDHNLPEGATAFVVYEKIVCNSEIYSNALKEGDSVVVIYDSIQLEERNDKSVITIKSIELADKNIPAE